jgi:FtsP/CotA-like multicopper oxidase with cupredoxin domain
MKSRIAASEAHELRLRRLLMLSAGLAAVAAFWLIAIHPQVSATSSGDPYSVPVATDTNPAANVLETTIVAEESTIEIGNGVLAHAQTFNGHIPGPTLFLNVGDTVIVHFQNHLKHQSGIHWHGIELASGMDGTPVTQNQVPPGGNFLYKFTVTRPGIFWYHPHHHASTDQVFKGLYGMIVVRDPNEAALQAKGTLPSASQTRPIVLSDTTVCKKPGSNDTETYAPGSPWVGGGALPKQQPPTPQNLCEGPGTAPPPAGGNPYPIDEDGVLRGPFEAGDIPNIQTANHAGSTNEGQTVLTNGKNVGARAGSPEAPGALAPGASVLNVQPGQGLHLQLLNASTVRYFRLRLTTEAGALVPLIRVGGEGGLLDKAVQEGGTEETWVTKYTPGEILLPPSGRADVVAAIPNAPTSGVLTLWTEDYQRTGPGYSDMPSVPVMHLNLSGPTVSPAYTIAAGTPLREATGHPVEALPEPKAGEELLNPATFTPPKPGLASQTIELTQVAQTELGVDHVFGVHDAPGNYENAPHLGSARYAKQGDVLQLEVKNTTGANHPFHLHGFSMQPISLTKGGESYTWPYKEFRDSIDVPGGFTLKFRIRIDPRPLPDGTTPGGALGRWLFHCHIFFHANDGMLSELVVTAPDGDERPDVNVDNSELSFTQGETATITGTYKDPDGDPVKLNSSVGGVVDNGGGKYTWTFPTTASTPTQIVYVTATDSHGLKGQIPFFLTLKKGAPSNNTSPAIKHLRVVPKSFAVGKGTTKLKRASASKAKHRRGGAKIKFNLSEASTVTFRIKRVAPKRPHLSAKAISRKFKSGGNKSVGFSGRFKHGGPLPPGKYKLTAQAVDGGGLRSKRVTAGFKIHR